MTEQEINRMRAQDGIYILGWKGSPGLTHVVAAQSGVVRQAVISENQLDPSPLAWSELELVAGPLTVQNQRELNEKAAQVAELVEMLEHDLRIWRDLALQAKRLLQVASFSDLSPGTAAFARRALEAIERAEGATAPKT